MSTTEVELRRLDGTYIGETVTFEASGGTVTGELISVQHSDTQTSINIAGTIYTVQDKPPHQPIIQIHDGTGDE